MKMNTSTNAPSTGVTLHASLAGMWYSPDETELRNELEGYLTGADPDPQLTNICALVLPHAGYRFSGPTAAAALKLVQGRAYKRVIVMGPSHRVALPNLVSAPEADQFVTPLGAVPLDLAFIRALNRTRFFDAVPQALDGENSVEIEIPLLQAALKEFKLVPLVVGQLDRKATREVATILSRMIGPETLVVASGDFTHYGPRFGYTPFKDNVKDHIRDLDLGAFEKMKNKDAEGFYEYVDRTGATICGKCPFAVLLDMLPGNAQVHKVQYASSGDITGDYGNPVSYLSAAVTGTWQGQEPVAADPEESADAAGEEPAAQTLGDKDKQNLLKLARGTLTRYLADGKKPAPDQLGVEITPGMKQVMGAFVTLHKKGDLRGCIGEIFPRRALYEAVIEHAVNAGVNDYRFQPVTPAELEDIDFEISALSQPRRVDTYNDIEIGRHGMVIHKYGRQAVFLPQVAPEQGWDRAETLTFLSRKAGLPPDAWKEDAEFDVFEAIVFGEKEH